MVKKLYGCTLWMAAMAIMLLLIPLRAEAAGLTGEITVLQDDCGNPPPVLQQNEDGRWTLAMYEHTLVRLEGAEIYGVERTEDRIGATSCILLSWHDYINGVEEDYLRIFGASVGIETVRLQIGYPVQEVLLTVLVLESSAPSSVTDPGRLEAALQWYSYADEHTIISKDGLVEINLDNFTLDASESIIENPAKIYYAADGLLTIEYTNSVVQASGTSLVDGYRFCTLSGSEDVQEGENLTYYTIIETGKLRPWGEIVHPDAKLWVRIIKNKKKMTEDDYWDRPSNRYCVCSLSLTTE